MRASQAWRRNGRFSSQFRTITRSDVSTAELTLDTARFGAQQPTARRHVSHLLSVSTRILAVWHPTRHLAQTHDCRSAEAHQTGAAPTARRQRVAKRAVLRPSAHNDDADEAHIPDSTSTAVSHTDERRPPRGGFAKATRSDARAYAPPAHTTTPAARAPSKRDQNVVDSLPISPFARAAGAATTTNGEPLTTAAVISFLISLQRLHRNARNNSFMLLRLRTLVVETAANLTLCVSSMTASQPRPSDAPQLQWTNELCEQILLTIALYGAVQTLRPVRAVTAACSKWLVSQAVDGAAVVCPGTDKAEADIDIDVLARRARLAGLLLSARRQRDDEEAFVTDVLAAYPLTDADAAVDNQIGTGAMYGATTTRVSEKRDDDHDGETVREETDVDPRDEYLFCSLLPYLYTQLAAICASPTQSVPLTALEREVFSRVCHVLTRAVTLQLVSCVSTLDTERTAPFDAGHVVVFGTAQTPGRLRRPIARTDFLKGVQRLTDGLVQEHAAKRHVLLHALTARTGGTHVVNAQEYCGDADGGSPPSSSSGSAAVLRLESKFHVDAVLPVLQLMLNGQSFSRLFVPDQKELREDVAEMTSVDLARSAATAAACVQRLLHVALEWAPLLLSYQVSAVTSLYSRALLATPLSHDATSDTTTTDTPDASSCDALQATMLAEVRATLMGKAPVPHLVEIRAADAVSPPGAVATWLLQAAMRRFEKFFPSDLVSLVAALQDIHGVVHTFHGDTAARDSDSGNAAGPVATVTTLNASRFTRKGKRDSGTVASALPPRSSSQHNGSSCIPAVFDWVAYESALQCFTSQALTLLAGHLRWGHSGTWELRLSSPRACTLAKRLPSAFCRVHNPAASTSGATPAAVWLIMPSSLVMTLGRSRETLGTFQQSTISPHELYLLTSALAAFPIARSSTTSSTRIPLMSLHSGSLFAWQGVLEQAVTGQVARYLGVYDHEGRAVTQLIASRLGLLPRAAIVDDVNGHNHRTFLIFSMQHGTTSFSASELAETLRPFTNASATTATLLAEVTAPTAANMLLLFFPASAVENFMWRESSHLAATDSIAVLLALLTQGDATAAAVVCQPLCFALWRHLQNAHRDTLTRLLAHDKTSVHPLSDDDIRFVAEVLMPFVLVCRAVLSHAMPRAVDKVADFRHAWRTRQAVDAGEVTATRLTGDAHLLTAAKCLHALCLVIQSALDNGVSTTVTNALSSSTSETSRTLRKLASSSASQPLWQVMAMCDLLAATVDNENATQPVTSTMPASSATAVGAETAASPLHSSDDGATSSSALSRLRLPPLSAKTTDVIGAALSAGLSMRSTEEIGHVLASTGSRRYSDVRDGWLHVTHTTPPSPPAQLWLAPLVWQHLPVWASFRQASLPQHRASLHYFTLLPFLLRESGPTAASTTTALRANPAALLADMAMRVGSACATLSGLVYMMRQISLVDPALLTGAMPTAAHWPGPVPEEEQIRLVATLYRHAARLLVEPLDALIAQAQNNTNDAEPTDVLDDLVSESPAAAAMSSVAASWRVRPWPYSPVDLLHLLVLLIEAEATCTRGASHTTLSPETHATQTADHTRRHSSDASTGLLSALLQLHQSSSLRLVTEETVTAALHLTLEAHAVPALLARAVRGLSALADDNTRLQQSALRLVALYMPYTMRDSLSAAAGDAAKGRRATGPVHAGTDARLNSNAHFLTLVHHVAKMDVNLLSDLVHRALVATAAPESVSRGSSTGHRHRRGGGGGARRYTSARVRSASHDAQSRLTALLTLSLMLFRQQTDRSGKSASTVAMSAMGVKTSTSEAATGRAAHRTHKLALQLLRRASRVLRVHWKDWVRSPEQELRAQLLVNLLDVPAVQTVGLFVSYSTRTLFYLHYAVYLAAVPLQVYHVPTTVRMPLSTHQEDRHSARPSPEAVLAALTTDGVVNDTGWLRTVAQLSTVDSENDYWPTFHGRVCWSYPRGHGADAHTHDEDQCDYENLQLTVRQSRSSGAKLVPLRSLSEAQQRHYSAVWCSRGSPLGPLKLSLRAYQALLFCDRAIVELPKARGAIPVFVVNAAIHYPLAHRLFRGLSFFAHMRERDISELRQQLGPMNFLTLATELLERYTREISLDLRRQIDASVRLFESLEAAERDPQLSEQQRAEREFAQVCDAVSRALRPALMPPATEAHTPFVDPLWSSTALARWLGAASSVVASLSNSGELTHLAAETCAASPHTIAEEDEEAQHPETGVANQETSDATAARGDTPEDGSVPPHRQHRTQRQHADTPGSAVGAVPTLTVDFGVLERFFDVLETLCPCLTPVGLMTCETAMQPSPVATTLAAIVRTVLSPSVGTLSDRNGFPVMVTHGLSSLVTFRQSAEVALALESEQALLSQSSGYSLPLTRDHPAIKKLLATDDDTVDAAPTVSTRDTQRNVLQRDRAVVEAALVDVVFPALRLPRCCGEDDAAAPGDSETLDLALCEQHVRHAAGSLQADDVARLLQLLVRTSAASADALKISAAAYETYVVALCDVLTELLPSLGGDTMRAVVEALLPIVAALKDETADADAGDDGGRTGARVLQRGLNRLCAHMPPLIAHDVERFTRSDLVFIVAALHTPSLFCVSQQSTSVDSVEEDEPLFAHSLVSKEAAVAILGALTTMHADTANNDTPDTEASEHDTGGDNPAFEEGLDVSVDPTAVLTNTPREMDAAALATRWRTLVRTLAAETQRGDNTRNRRNATHTAAVISRLDCLAILDIAAQTAL